MSVRRFVCLSVCLSAHIPGIGRAILCNFSGQQQGAPGMVLGAKNRGKNLGG